MFGTGKHFAVAAAVSGATGIALEVTARAATLSGADTPPAMPLDGAHLLAAAPLFLIGAVLVGLVPALAPDPALRRGPAPRAFWTLAAGVALRAWAGPIASADERFLAALALGGSFLELAGLALVAIPVTRPARAVPSSVVPPAQAPEPALTPQGASGTEAGPSGS